jgi:predicted methyltransferase
MARDFTKTDIRLSKIRTRSLKPSYKMLSCEEKRLVKALEVRVQLEREMGIIGRRDKNWRLTETGQNLLEHYLRSGDRLESARCRFEIKTSKDLTENEELMLVNSTRCNRFYGGAF